MKLSSPHPTLLSNPLPIENIGQDLPAEIQASLAGSEFLCDLATKHPEWLDLWRDITATSSEEILQDIFTQMEKLSLIEDEKRLMAQSRLLKNHANFIIALSELSGAWDFKQTVTAITAMAEILVAQIFSFALKKMSDAFPANMGISPKDCGFTIIALGKLGAGELNYSSDIDLLMLYDEEKFACHQAHKKDQTAQRLAQYIIYLIEQRTADGYLFRTDLRLRPNPSSTPAAVKITPAIIYYESIARNWERMVLIRAHPIAGDIALGENFLQQISSFTWRRSIDYSTLHDIHQIYQQTISHQSGDNDWQGYNVKTGKGGIRSCEFYIQMLQLLWGGKYPHLRSRHTLVALEALHDDGYVTDEIYQHIKIAYPYLRSIEHRLQMQDDRQIQTLPTQTELFEVFAQFAGYQNTQSLIDALQHISHICHQNYQNLVNGFAEQHPEDDTANHIISDTKDDTIASHLIGAPFLQELGFASSETEQLIEIIHDWQMGKLRATASDRAQILLNKLLPDLLHHLSATLNPNQALLAFNQFLTSLPAGIQLFSLFNAHPPLMQIIADIMGNAPMLAKILAYHPELLEIFLEEFQIPTDKNDALNLLHKRVAHHSDYRTDYQDMLSQLVIFCREQQFAIGRQILTGQADIVQTAHSLTAIAEATIEMLVTRLQQDFQKTYGTCGEFAVVAMGKFGSQLLLPHSDLDLLFLYKPTQEQSDGQKSLFASTYYQKFAQRLVSALTVRTESGELYEVDLRLRPWGNDGAVANQLSTYQSYYRDEAFASEKIALSRARVIYGSDDYKAEIEQTFSQILQSKPVSAQDFLHDIANMRLRISKTYANTGLFNLKHKMGGLLELEFILEVLYQKALSDGKMPYLQDFFSIITHLEQQNYLTQSEAEILQETMNFYLCLQAGMRLTALNHTILDPLISEDNRSQNAQQNFILTHADILANIAKVENFNILIDKCHDLQQKIIKIYHHHIGQYHQYQPDKL